MQFTLVEVYDYVQKYIDGPYLKLTHTKSGQEGAQACTYVFHIKVNREVIITGNMYMYMYLQM